jgi:hypothetical protein
VGPVYDILFVIGHSLTAGDIALGEQKRGIRILTPIAWPDTVYIALVEMAR